MRIYLYKYDTVHGRLDREVSVDGDTLIVDGSSVAVLHDRDPENLDWSSYGVEIVVESTGKLKDKASASKHIRGTVKKVIITAPGKDEDATIVMGVNEEIYDPANHSIISNASCTTNYLAPVVKVLNNTFGIEEGLMTTVHSIPMTRLFWIRTTRRMQEEAVQGQKILFQPAPAPLRPLVLLFRP